MISPKFAAGTNAAALCRSLAGNADPLALYAALSEGGAKRDTMLFEQLDGPTFLLDSAALRVECRGGDVKVIAMSANGVNLLETLAERLPDHVNGVCFRFPRTEGSDAAQRLDAPSPFDVLR